LTSKLPSINKQKKYIYIYFNTIDGLPRQPAFRTEGHPPWHLLQSGLFEEWYTMRNDSLADWVWEYPDALLKKFVPCQTIDSYILSDILS
jgi:hypothetical protein